MSKDQKEPKKWGGPFDFDRNGETSLSERLRGEHRMRELRKQFTSHAGKSASERKEHKDTSLPVPEVVDEAAYRALLEEYRNSCIAMVVTSILLLIPAAFILWGVFQSQDLSTSAGRFITLLFSGAGLIYICSVLYAMRKVMDEARKKLELAEQRYTGTPQEERPEDHLLLWVFLFAVLIGLLILLTR